MDGAATSLYEIVSFKGYVLLYKTLKGDLSEEWVVIGLYRIPRPFLNTFFKIVKTFLLN